MTGSCIFFRTLRPFISLHGLLYLSAEACPQHALPQARNPHAALRNAVLQVSKTTSYASFVCTETALPLFDFEAQW